MSANKTCDVLLVFVNKHEKSAVISAFKDLTEQPKFKPHHGERNMYTDFGVIENTAVIGLQIAMGSGPRNAAQAAVGAAVRELKPRAVILVGVAFGMNPQKHAIGDILISRQLALYEPAKRKKTADGKAWLERGDRASAPEWLFNRVNYYTGEDEWADCPIHIGLMVSGEKLIDDAEFKAKLLQIYPEAIGGEMEGAGAYVAAETEKKEWLIVKGVCDYADGQKSKNKTANQKQAAANAARFVAMVIGEGALSNPKTQSRPTSPADTSVDESTQNNTENQPARQTNTTNASHPHHTIQIDTAADDRVQPQNQQNPPRVFISYSHDSEPHKQKVWDLAVKLRQADIHSIIDQEIANPPEGWPKWMDRELHTSRFVLVICTATYINRVMGTEKEGQGRGVRFESTLTYNDFFRKDSETNKYIPILFKDGRQDDIPNPLQGHTCYRLENNNGWDDQQCNQLVDFLKDIQRRVLPPVGGGPSSRQPKTAADPQTEDADKRCDDDPRAADETRRRRITEQISQLLADPLLTDWKSQFAAELGDQNQTTDLAAYLVQRPLNQLHQTLKAANKALDQLFKDGSKPLEKATQLKMWRQIKLALEWLLLLAFDPSVFSDGKPIDTPPVMEPPGAFPEMVCFLNGARHDRPPHLQKAAEGNHLLSPNGVFSDQFQLVRDHGAGVTLNTFAIKKMLYFYYCQAEALYQAPFHQAFKCDDLKTPNEENMTNWLLTALDSGDHPDPFVAVLPNDRGALPIEDDRVYRQLQADLNNLLPIYFLVDKDLGDGVLVSWSTINYHLTRFFQLQPTSPPPFV